MTTARWIDTSWMHVYELGVGCWVRGEKQIHDGGGGKEGQRKRWFVNEKQGHAQQNPPRLFPHHSYINYSSLFVSPQRLHNRLQDGKGEDYLKLVYKACSLISHLLPSEQNKEH